MVDRAKFSHCLPTLLGLMFMPYDKEGENASPGVEVLMLIDLTKKKIIHSDYQRTEF